VVLAGQNGLSALLAGADPCAQQTNAYAMIDFAKLPGIKNEQALIANAVAYRKHPRNALDINGGLIPSTPFCETAPKNPELNGVVNGQLAGVDPGLFGGPKFAVVAFGAREEIRLKKKCAWLWIGSLIISVFHFSWYLPLWPDG